MRPADMPTAPTAPVSRGTVARPAPVAKYSGPQTWTGKRDHLKASGVTWEFMKKEHDGRQHSATGFIGAKLRANGTPLDAVGLEDDVNAHTLVLPRHAPDALARPEACCRAIDAAVRQPGHYLLVGFTVWHHGTYPNHLLFRQVRAFVEDAVVDRFGVGAFVIGHDPAFHGKTSDFHVHVYHPVLRITSSGLGGVVGQLLDLGRYKQVAQAWEARRDQARGNDAAPAA